MPPLPAIRLPVLFALAQELRFAPRATLLRQLARAESLAQEIEIDGEYPNDWLVFRITGYRPEQSNAAITNSDGCDVQRDLSALCEHLSAIAKISLSDISPAPMRVDDLEKHWNISRKTIDRLRRRGLTARRVLDAQARSTLVFLPKIIKQFERAHADTLADAARFSRFDDATHAALIGRARESHAYTGASLSAVAKMLAHEFDRSHEGVRQMLLRNEQAGSPVFHAVSAKPDHRRRVAFRARSMGIPVSAIAAHFGRTTTSVHRLILIERAARIANIHIQSNDTASVGDGAIDRNEVKIKGLGTPGLVDLAAFIAHARTIKPPKATIEKHATQVHAQLQLTAITLIARGAAAAPRADAVDEIETVLRSIARVRAHLVHMELGLAITTLDQQLGVRVEDFPSAQLTDMIQQMVQVMATAVQSHTPARGGRLASPIGLSLTKLAHTWTGSIPKSSVGKAQRTLNAGTHIDDWTRTVCAWQAWLEPDPRVRTHLYGLPDDRADLLRARYGWNGSLPQTTAELAAARGIKSHHVVRAVCTAEQQALTIARSGQ